MTLLPRIGMEESPLTTAVQELRLPQNVLSSHVITHSLSRAGLLTLPPELRFHIIEYFISSNYLIRLSNSTFFYVYDALDQISRYQGGTASELRPVLELPRAKSHSGTIFSALGVDIVALMATCKDLRLDVLSAIERTFTFAIDPSVPSSMPEISLASSIRYMLIDGHGLDWSDVDIDFNYFPALRELIVNIDMEPGTSPLPFLSRLNTLANGHARPGSMHGIRVPTAHMVGEVAQNHIWNQASTGTASVTTYLEENGIVALNNIVPKFAPSSRHVRIILEILRDQKACEERTERYECNRLFCTIIRIISQFVSKRGEGKTYPEIRKQHIQDNYPVFTILTKYPVQPVGASGTVTPSASGRSENLRVGSMTFRRAMKPLCRDVRWNDEEKSRWHDSHNFVFKRMSNALSPYPIPLNFRPLEPYIQRVIRQINPLQDWQRA